MQATSPSSILSADKSRRPRFSLADDTDDDEDVQTRSRNETSPRHPPSIVISGEPSRRSESRDRHVGFAAAPIINETPTPEDAAPALEREREGGTDPEKKSPPSSSENSYPPTGRHAFDKPEFATQPPGPPTAAKEKKKSRLPALPRFMAWIPRNLNWKGLRPVVRASIAAWCGLLLSESPEGYPDRGKSSADAIRTPLQCSAAHPRGRSGRRASSCSSSRQSRRPRSR